MWYFALIYFCIQIAVYGFTFFLPTQVDGHHRAELGFQASLVTAIPWVFALAAVAFSQVWPTGPQTPADRHVRCFWSPPSESSSPER